MVMLKISIGIYAELAMIVSVALTQKNIPYQKNSYSCLALGRGLCPTVEKDCEAGA